MISVIKEYRRRKIGSEPVCCRKYFSMNLYAETVNYNTCIHAGLL